MEVVIASSSIDAGIGCWDLKTGAEQLRYKTCSSSPHGLTCVGGRFLASSQQREPSIFYWSWFKPPVAERSHPAEPIKPLASNKEGTYIVGGGLSGHIYLWEVSSGELLKKWHAHYRAVSCLVFSDDDSLLISGADDGCVRVWSLFMIFDQLRRDEASHLYEHSFSEHTLPVTDIVTGYGGCNAIIVSASEDRTCKVWSLSKGNLLRNIVFTSIIDAIALDPGENVFYAGGRDGKIYIAALHAEGSSKNSYGKHIIGLLHDHSKPITCLANSLDGNLLVSGSEDGMVRVWDTKSYNIVRMFKHAKGPVNNVLVVRQYASPTSQASARRQGLMLPQLKRFVEEESDHKAIIGFQSACSEHLDASYLSSEVIQSQTKELKQQGSASAMEMEMERLKHDGQKSMQMVQQWRTMYGNLHEFCVNELLDGDVNQQQ